MIALRSVLKVLPAVLLAGLALGWPGMGRAGVVTYQATIDTSSLGGQSYFLDFQFNPADATSPAATATVYNLGTDGTVGAVLGTSGDETGDLSSPPVQFDNGTPDNELAQGFTFGASLDFFVDLQVTNPAAAGSDSTFAVTIFDSTGNPYLQADPARGDAALYIDLHADGTISTEASPSVSVTPEPASLTLVAIAAMGLCGAAWRRRRARGRWAE